MTRDCQGFAPAGYEGGGQINACSAAAALPLKGRPALEPVLLVAPESSPRLLYDASHNRQSI